VAVIHSDDAIFFIALCHTLWLKGEEIEIQLC